MLRSPRWILTLVAFGLASVVNPGYFSGCASDGPEEPGPWKFQFGEAEMLDLLDEANASGPFEIMQANEQYRIELTLSEAIGDDSDDSALLQPRAAFGSRAYACGNRSFMQSASACIPTSSVALKALVSVYKLGPSGDEEILKEQELEGTMSVLGLELGNAQVSLAASDADTPTRVSLTSNDGKTFTLSKFTTRTSGTTLF